jgi:hypothetical protein
MILSSRSAFALVLPHTGEFLESLIQSDAAYSVFICMRTFFSAAESILRVTINSQLSCGSKI